MYNDYAEADGIAYSAMVAERQELESIPKSERTESENIRLHRIDNMVV